jgi:hypothetical protein
MQDHTRQSEVITAKWKTSLATGEEIYGTIALDDKFELVFPMLESQGRIPDGTSLLWGLSDHLKRCSALTLPFRFGGVCYTPTERLYSRRSAIRYLLLGPNYIADPAGDFVREIVFTPQPDKDLHKGEPLDSVPGLEPLFSVDVPSLGGTIAAQALGRSLLVGIHFSQLHKLQAAIEEANKLCVFLSFLAHQCVMPSDLRIFANDETEPYQLHCRSFKPAPARENTWAGYTALRADDHPAFSEVLQKWYASNDTHLRSRYYYRYSLTEPLVFTPMRFLAVFQAVEGIMDRSGYQLLSTTQFTAAKDAIRQALPATPDLDLFLRKLNNSRSLDFILKKELPRICALADVIPLFSIDEFVKRICRRRNLASHGGHHFDDTATDDTFVPDTMLLTVFYVVLESQQIGLNPRDTLKKFLASLGSPELPLKLPL